MKNHNYYLGIAMLFFMFVSCNTDKKEPATNEITFSYDKVTPVEFPILDIPNFNFPEDSIVLNNWIYENDTLNIYKHAWGIWAGLTSPTDQNIGGQTLLVYETWLTPEEMIDSINNRPIRRSNRANLKRPNQFTHFQQTVNNSIHESVSYSPAAANHAIKNKLFLATTLYDYAQQGMTEIPNFPNDAITIKPVFKILPASSGGQVKFAITTWHGTIDSLAAFPESDWHSCVYVDITNKSHGDGSQLFFPNSKNPPAPTAATTYNLNDFINYKLNEEDAYFFNKEFTENATNPLNAKVGDIVVLVGMHVTTKENKRWTWQTFWWAPDPDSPPLPSSKTIAEQRPSALVGAASHYAMAVAYYMVNPKEPYSGTNITGKPNYAWNPYLESEFGPGMFDSTISFVETNIRKKIPTYVGVRTNCMSCHAFATIYPDGLSSDKISKTSYVGNSYVSLNDSLFKNQLKLDFSWSIEGNVDTTGIKSFINKYSRKDK